MVSQATLNKHANALITLFVRLWKEKYPDKEPQINRYREKWGFLSMVEDLGYPRAQEVVEHYFKTGRVGHPVQQLLFNYDKLNKVMLELAEDEKKRAELRAATEKRVREWESARGNK